MYKCQECKNWKIKREDGRQESPEDSGLYYCTSCYENTDVKDECCCLNGCDWCLMLERRSLKND